MGARPPALPTPRGTRTPPASSLVSGEGQKGGPGGFYGGCMVGWRSSWDGGRGYQGLGRIMASWGAIWGCWRGSSGGWGGLLDAGVAFEAWQHRDPHQSCAPDAPPDLQVKSEPGSPTSSHCSDSSGLSSASEPLAWVCPPSLVPLLPPAAPSAHLLPLSSVPTGPQPPRAGGEDRANPSAALYPP